MTDSKPPASAEIDIPKWIREAQGRWPRVALEEADFRRHLNALGRSIPVFPIDVFLAAACSAGDAVALRAIEDDFVARVPEVTRRFDPSPAFAAEIRQQLRIRLFVRENDAPPRIARYTGEVPLAVWIRVIALRLALNAKRGKTHAVGDEAEIHDAAIDDPEIEYLRGQYREPFVRSFDAALAALPKDDRTMLRLHYVDGVNIDGIGRVFQVHRATVARSLVRIRSELLARTKTLLAEQIGTDLDEADSVMGALAGELDVTLSRVLGG